MTWSTRDPRFLCHDEGAVRRPAWLRLRQGESPGRPNGPDARRDGAPAVHTLHFLVFPACGELGG